MPGSVATSIISALLWVTVGMDPAMAKYQAYSLIPHQTRISNAQFKLLTQSRSFALEFVSNGKAKQVPIPRDWLVLPEKAKAEEYNYVSSFLYRSQVTSFPIGNGKIGLQLSSYSIQAEGSAQAAAGRDIFVTLDPGSSTVFNGGIERGVTRSAFVRQDASRLKRRSIS